MFKKKKCNIKRNKSAKLNSVRFNETYNSYETFLAIKTESVKK